MPNPMVVEVTSRDNRLGWWGIFHHYKFSLCDIHEVFDKLASYETPVSVTVDGKLIYRSDDRHCGS